MLCLILGPSPFSLVIRFECAESRSFDFRDCGFWIVGTNCWKIYFVVFFFSNTSKVSRIIELNDSMTKLYILLLVVYF